MKLKQTKVPVFAYAIDAPEPFGRLSKCYASYVLKCTGALKAVGCTSDCRPWSTGRILVGFEVVEILPAWLPRFAIPVVLMQPTVVTTRFISSPPD
jgi:hypothetical protein